MKYIKTYEELLPVFTSSEKYEIGDYVFVDLNIMWKDDKDKHVGYAKILDIDKGVSIPFFVKAIYREDRTVKFWTGTPARKLTPEEIEEFETIIDSKKYNL